MGDIILTWVFVLSTLGSLYFIPVSLKNWPRGERCRCPGPRRGWRFFLGYRWIVLRGRCWYNLRTLPRDSAGYVLCPECGSEVLPHRLFKDGRRLRTGRFALASLAIAMCTAFSGPLHNGSWAKALPSYPLVVLSTTMLGEYQTDIRNEVRLRAMNGLLSGRSASLLSVTLAKELRDDEVQWNAYAAEHILERMWPLSKEALELETIAGDEQSRIIAARILRLKCKIPSEVLIAACLADLQDDSNMVHWRIQQGNATESVRYLLKWWNISKQHILAALDSTDEQQQFYAAVIAGKKGTKSRVRDVVVLLAPHLMDNKINSDSHLAASALRRLGSEAIPFLRKQLFCSDSRGRNSLLQIIEYLEQQD